MLETPPGDQNVSYRGGGHNLAADQSKTRATVEAAVATRTT